MPPSVLNDAEQVYSFCEREFIRKLVWRIP
jgi:hypothetical protein